MKMTKKQLMVCIAGVVALNAVIIIGILSFAWSRATMSPKTSEEWLVNTPEYAEETDGAEADDGMVQEVTDIQETDSGLFKKEDEMLSESEYYHMIYSALIPGTYETEEGMAFVFYADGTFDGYYNAENPNVTRYNYQIKGDAGTDCYIKISNPTFTESESYPLEFTSDGKILMYYAEDKFIELGV